MKSFGRRTRIDQYSIHDQYIKSWSSIKEAANSLGFTAQTISNCLRGLRTSAHGFKWKYSVDPDIIGEIWQPYPLNNRFLVSNKGRIQTPTGKRTYGYNIGGYMRIRTSSVSTSVHRMVALTFLQKPFNCEVVNHIDHNKQNNMVENLEWTDQKGNAQASEKFYNKLTWDGNEYRAFHGTTTSDSAGYHRKWEDIYL